MEHTWEIHNLKRNLSDGLVTTASYWCKTEFSGENARSVGEYYLPAKDSSDPDFVSYDSLTQDIVLGWITGSLDTEAMYSKHSASIAERLYQKANTTSANGTPW